MLAEAPASRVYVARSADGSRVALKELMFSLVPSIEQLDAFEREATFLRGLDHPQTPKFRESFAVGEGVEMRLYLAQEFIEGVSLLTRLSRAPITADDFDSIAMQALTVLQVLHARQPKIIHRDLKPENLIFRSNGDLVLVDFGSARHIEQLATMRSTLVGTYGYMPPEQLGGTVDETSDLYALGATLLHAATGAPPSHWLIDGFRLEVSGVRKLLPRQVEFLKRLVAVRRADRFVNASAAMAGLRRRPIRWKALTGVAAVMIAGAAFGAMRPVEPPPRAPNPRIYPLPPEVPVEVPQAPGGIPDPSFKALEAERVNGMKGLWIAQKNYFSAQDHFTMNARESGMSVSDWCEDGARLRITIKPQENEMMGCHFIYGLKLHGSGPSGTFTVYAYGAIAPVLGQAWILESDGPHSGIPESITPAQLSAMIDGE